MGHGLLHEDRKFLAEKYGIRLNDGRRVRYPRRRLIDVWFCPRKWTFVAARVVRPSCARSWRIARSN